MQNGSRSYEAALARLASEGADAASIAAAASAMWQRISAALAPIIGQHGVAALYKRSLQVTSSQHPALSLVQGGGAIEDFSSLGSALSSQTGAAAAAAHQALLANFHSLLSSLVGESLTERLLAPVWDSPSDPHAIPESPP